MNETQLIKDKLDVVDFINEYVKLKPAGSSHKGLCPFHNEKSPSFMVSRERQAWYCFGCQKGGDVFTFLQEMEGMDFIESLKYLAQRTGVQLQERAGNKTDQNQKNRLRDINASASNFFHQFLLSMDQSKDARVYIQNRGLTEKTIDAWQIGFVPDQWRLLTEYLLKKGYGIDDLVISGLTIKKDNAQVNSGRGFYDRFRGRVMFPIKDTYGYVVGFTGRILVETEQSGGKYVNTPQTPLYDKSRVLFGLYQAKKAIKQKDRAVVVEGQMDVISSHQAGIEEVVASSGTALTEEQIQLLKRYTKNIYMAFDGDAAGLNAAKRGIDIALEAGMNVRIITLPPEAGKDPDDCIQKDPNLWKQAIEDAKDIMAWYIEIAFEGKDMKDPQQKEMVADTLLAEVARLPSAITQDHWLQIIGGRMRTDVSVLRDDLGRFSVKKDERQPHHTRATQQDTSDETYEKKTTFQSRTAILEHRLLLLLIQSPQSWPKAREILDQLDMLDCVYAPLYEQIKIAYTSEASWDPKVVLHDTHELFDTGVDVLLLQSDEEFSAMTPGELQKEMDTVSQELLLEWKKERREKIAELIQTAEREGNAARVQELLQEFQQI